MTRAAAPASALADVWSWPLPEEAYVPGRTTRPESGDVFDIAEAAPDVTDPACWRDNEAWLAGFRLYRAGYFWEAHEVWEPVWMGARPNSAERALAQGVIQLANACLKLRMERPKAAARLVALAGECLADATSGGQAREVMGLDMVALRTAITRFAGELSLGPEAALAQRPVLRLQDTPHQKNMHHNAYLA
ncbi:DUF309 domain-containing protein [Amorphus sp. 3PC139-8]|uniref:DUF309 domain-containing protein n=1 Tax=Amorphus sp. 3PC139-8 TaxID=2735676 RepID=UPI00345C8612